MIVETKKLAEAKWFGRVVTKKFKGPWQGPRATEEDIIDDARTSWAVAQQKVLTPV